jgi:glycosyltransferase involved in cell wall biosynthesis
VSVVVCAYTELRWQDLVAACESVKRQLTSADQLVVVVDHNDALLARATEGLPYAKVVASAGRQGLSGARNTGIARSGGQVIIFLDDDAVPREDWIARIRPMFGNGLVSVVGTHVEPRWEGGRAPRWFPLEFGWVVGCSYTGLPTLVDHIRNPIGASMAVDRSAFVVAGTFVETIGRIGTLPVGCEETEFCIRLKRLSARSTIIYKPDAVVDHLVPRARQTVKYFVRRCFHEGRSKHVVARLSGSSTALSAERQYVRRVLPRAVARGLNPLSVLRDPTVVSRAAAVLLGLAATAVGFITAGRVNGK